MDLRKLAVAETKRLHLRDAEDNLLYSDEAKKLPCVVVLYGPGSKGYAKAQTKKGNRMLDELKRKGKTNHTAEQNQYETAVFLADCTHSWENIEMDDLSGTELSMAIYSDRSIGFIVDQVSKELNDWSNFIKPSQTS